MKSGYFALFCMIFAFLILPQASHSMTVGDGSVSTRMHTDSQTDAAPSVQGKTTSKTILLANIQDRTLYGKDGRVHQVPEDVKITNSVARGARAVIATFFFVDGRLSSVVIK